MIETEQILLFFAVILFIILLYERNKSKNPQSAKLERLQKPKSNKSQSPTKKSLNSKKVEKKPKSSKGQSSTKKSLNSEKVEVDEDIFMTPKKREAAARWAKQLSKPTKPSKGTLKPPTAREIFQQEFDEIGVTGMARIVRRALKSYPHQEFFDLSKLTTSKSKVLEICEELNNEIKADYRTAIIEVIGEKFSEAKYRKVLDKAVKELMVMGFDAVKNEYDLNSSTDDEALEQATKIKKSHNIEARSIEKTDSWRQIRKRLR